MRDHKPISVESLLAHIPLLDELLPEEISRIAKGTREIVANKGEILFHKGDPCTGFYLLVYGQVKLAFISSQGNEKVVEVVCQGQSFGEAIMFMDKPYIVTAQALNDSRLLHISKTVIFEGLRRDPDFARKMLAGMGMRLHQLLVDVEDYSLHSGRQRIIGYLLRELDESQLDGTNVALELPVKKNVIASRLNLTQEHFSRILHELSDLGLLALDGRRILIPSVAKLIQHHH